jgi:hypothetical protein
MCIPPSDEDAAVRILELFRQRKARPSHVLKHGEALTTYAKGQVQLTDFKVGCDYAVEQGWIRETGPGSGDYMLTKAGFSAYLQLTIESA